MEKDKLDTVDFMSFINSMSKLDEMNTPKKRKNLNVLLRKLMKMQMVKTLLLIKISKKKMM